MTAKEKKDDMINPFLEREYWESEIIIQMEVEGCLTTSESEGIMRSSPDILQDCWNRNISPYRTAKRILKD
jgi:hypothetical protein